MSSCPCGALNFRFPDGLVIFAFDLHGDGQPLHTLRRFDQVAVAPVAPGILHIVVKDKLVYRGYHVEKALPGDVVRLHDGNFLARFHCGAIVCAPKIA